MSLSPCRLSPAARLLLPLSLVAACASGAGSKGDSAGLDSGGADGAQGTDTSDTADTGEAGDETAAPAAAGDCPTAAEVLVGATQDEALEGAAEITEITLADGGSSVTGAGAVAEGATVRIGAAGAYRLTGAATDAQIIVETSDVDDVLLILDGVDLTSASGPALHVVAAEQVVVFLSADRENTLRDSAGSLVDGAAGAAVWSAADLSLRGPGALLVEGNAGDGILSKDSLHIHNGALTIRAVDDGLVGRDKVEVDGGAVQIDAGGDGLKSTNAEEADRGGVQIDGGGLWVTAGGDLIDAAQQLELNGGALVGVAGGGASGAAAAGASAKGLKAGTALIIAGGAAQIDAAEDGLHSDGGLRLSAGAVCVAAGDDGAHAEDLAAVSGGALTVTTAYEGLEAATVEISGGAVWLNTDDDGVNVGGGAEASGGAVTADTVLRVSGGALTIYAQGDGLDSNGSIEISGGQTLVHGPTADNNGATDYGDRGATFTVTGGQLVAIGSAGMAVAPTSGSTQRALLLNLGAQPAGALVHLEGPDGGLLTVAPAKAWASVLFSSPDLGAGDHSASVGGAATGEAVDGLYAPDDYSGGAEVEAFTISDTITTIGEAGGPGGGRP